jgi:hypothetical protein
MLQLEADPSHSGFRHLRGRPSPIEQRGDGPAALGVRKGVWSSRDGGPGDRARTLMAWRHAWRIPLTPW